jgi:hypothetical protein
MARRNLKGRIYAGCLHCRKWSGSDELRIANEWIERHWRSCPRTSLFTSSEPPRDP